MRVVVFYLLFYASLFANTTTKTDINNPTTLLVALTTLVLVLLLVTLIKLFQEVQKRKLLQKELDRFKHELEDHIKDELEHNKQHQQEMFRQSRMAQMGEMLGMIAHQWKQPIASISAVTSTLRLTVMLDSFDLSKEEEREKQRSFFNEQLDYYDTYTRTLTQIIHDFKNFFNPNKKPTNLLMHEPVDKALAIIEKALIQDGIEIFKKYNSKQKVEMLDSEMMQVILNILKNAQDNFQEREIKEPYISITTYDNSNGDVTLEIFDNGGGIPPAIIDKVFEPYFSTKHKKSGTGLGLHMSKIIAEEHHNGSFLVDNYRQGSRFSIKLPQKLSAIQNSTKDNL